MKKRRLGEVLRERGHLSTADFNQILLDQRGKRIHLGELLLQNNKVAKIDLISALAEVSDIPYLDCTRVQVDHAALKVIPQAMARHCKCASHCHPGIQPDCRHGRASEFAVPRRTALQIGKEDHSAAGISQ